MIFTKNIRFEACRDKSSLYFIKYLQKLETGWENEINLVEEISILLLSI